jgi:hypothetical protein
MTFFLRSSVPPSVVGILSRNLSILNELIECMTEWRILSTRSAHKEFRDVWSSQNIVLQLTRSKPLPWSKVPTQKILGERDKTSSLNAASAASLE